jgi:hypothetical protein
MGAVWISPAPSDRKATLQRSHSKPLRTKSVGTNVGDARQASAAGQVRDAQSLPKGYRWSILMQRLRDGHQGRSHTVRLERQPLITAVDPSSKIEVADVSWILAMLFLALHVVTHSSHMLSLASVPFSMAQLNPGSPSWSLR